MAHLKFDDSLNDETGNHNGTVLAAATGATPAFDVGKIGKAVLIDGYDVVVELANPSTIDLAADFSIVAWVKTTATGERVVLFKGSPDNPWRAPNRQFNLLDGGPGPVNGPFLYAEGQGAYGTSFETTDSLVPNDGNWHQVALTYRATGSPHVTLYLDGRGHVGSDPGAFPFFGGDVVLQPSATDSVVRIGGREPGAAGSTFNGLIDEVQIYDKTLDTNQIKFLFDNPGQVVLPQVQVAGLAWISTDNHCPKPRLI